MESTNDELRELSAFFIEGGFMFIDEMEFHIEASGLKR